MTMTWKWELVIYLWIAGIAGGAYFVAFVVNWLTGRKAEQLPKIALLVGVPLVLVGSLLLIVDLGEQLRAWHLFTTFKIGSPMNMGTWILTLFAVIGVVMLVLWWSKSAERGSTKPAALSGLAGAISRLAGVLGVLSWIQLILAVLLIAYTGVLLSASNQPMWAGVLLLPALFVVSAIATGMAMLVLVMRTGFGRWVDEFLGGAGEPVPNDIVHTMGLASIALGIIEIVVLVGFLVWLGFFSGAAGAAAMAVLLTGPMSVLFWGGVVLLGLVIPLVLEVVSVRGKEVLGSVLASASLILLGGFFLRAVVLLGGQIV